MEKLVLTKSEAKQFRRKVSELLTKIDIGIKQHAADNHNKVITTIQLSIDYIADQQVENFVKKLLIEDYEWTGATFNRDKGILYVNLPW